MVKRILTMIALWMFLGCLCAGCGYAQFAHNVTADGDVDDPSIEWMWVVETGLRMKIDGVEGQGQYTGEGESESEAAND